MDRHKLQWFYQVLSVDCNLQHGFHSMIYMLYHRSHKDLSGSGHSACMSGTLQIRTRHRAIFLLHLQLVCHSCFWPTDSLKDMWPHLHHKRVHFRQLAPDNKQDMKWVCIFLRNDIQYNHIRLACNLIFEGRIDSEYQHFNRARYPWTPPTCLRA